MLRSWLARLVGGRAATPPAYLDEPMLRYMTLPKFLAMIDAGGLYFARADLLGDPWEGTATRAVIEAVAGALDGGKVTRTALPPTIAGTLDFILEARRTGTYKVDALTAEDIAEILHFTRSAYYASCWHMGRHENSTMWSTYTAGATGVAVETTPTSAVEAIQLENGEDFHFWLGPVRYIDFENDDLGFREDHHLLLTKRAEFSAERECRILLVREKTKQDGEVVRVDLARLVHRVLAAPGMPAWEREVLERTCSKLGVPVSIGPSALERKPWTGPSQDAESSG